MERNTEHLRKYLRRAMWAIGFICSVYLLLLLSCVIPFLWGLIRITVTIAKHRYPDGNDTKAVIFLVIFGVLSYIFLRILLKKQKEPPHNKIELSKQNAPLLFEMIEDLTTHIGCSFPKNVYVRHGVNASVFFENSFKNLFFRPPMNLEIGAGLINTSTASELRAVLAHEFGHFGQKELRMGSYVYYANRVLYTLFVKREGVQTLKDLEHSGFLPLMMAGGLLQVASDLLNKLLDAAYGMVNKSYLKLSTELEFQADFVAANHSAKGALSSALMRMDFSDVAFQEVIQFYEDRVSENVRTKNLYAQHMWILLDKADRNNLSIRHNLPLITKKVLEKFTTSKVIIADQWASHPPMEKRVERMQAVISNEEEDNESAWKYFESPSKIQEDLTQQIFSVVQSDLPPQFLTDEHFISEVQKRAAMYKLDKAYRDVYDDREIFMFNLTEARLSAEPIVPMQAIFNEKLEAMAYAVKGIESDIEILKQVKIPENKVKWFEYEGEKVKRDDADRIIGLLEAKLEIIQKHFEDADRKSFRYFLSLEQQRRTEAQLENAYDQNFKMQNRMKEYEDFLRELIRLSEFIYVQTPIEYIYGHCRSLYNHEMRFKPILSFLFENLNGKEELPPDVRKTVTEYLQQSQTYFLGHTYNQVALHQLDTTIRVFSLMVARTRYKSKKTVLDKQMALLN